MQKVNKNNQGFALSAVILIALVILIIGFVGYLVMSNQADDNKAIDTNQAKPADKQIEANEVKEVEPADIAKQFIEGMQKGDKKLADGVLSKEFVALSKEQFGTSSFYDGCKAISECYESFTALKLQSSTAKTSEYTSESKAKGKTVTFTQKADTGSSSASSSYSLSISLINSGDTWLVDDFVVGSENSANI